MALPLLRIPGMPLTNQHQSFPSNTRRKATTAKAELGTAVARTGGAGYQSPSVDVPTHKVTVHDRQRGIVHEFVVPEVPSFTLQLHAVDFCFCDPRGTEINGPYCFFS